MGDVWESKIGRWYTEQGGQIVFQYRSCADWRREHRGWDRIIREEGPLWRVPPFEEAS